MNNNNSKHTYLVPMNQEPAHPDMASRTGITQVIKYLEETHDVSYFTVPGDIVFSRFFEHHSDQFELVTQIFSGVGNISRLSIHDAINKADASLIETGGLQNNLYRHIDTNVYYGRLPKSFEDGMKSGMNVLMVSSLVQLQEFSRIVFTALELKPHTGISVDFVDSSSSGALFNRELFKRLVQRDEVFMGPIKDEIFTSIDQFFSNTSFYETYNIPFRRGILLYGLPGNGKTTLIHAIITTTELERTVFWQIDENTTSTVIRSMFKQLRGAGKRTLLIIEDIDSIPHHSRSTFLNQLDGAESSNGLFIIASTNYPERIDPALMNRAGRFDRAYEIQKPTADHRRGYLTNKGLLKFATEEELEYFVKESDDFSMSLLNEIYTTAASQHFLNQGVIDKERVMDGLKETHRKQKRQVFTDKAEAERLGFKL